MGKRPHWYINGSDNIKCIDGKQPKGQVRGTK